MPHRNIRYVLLVVFLLGMLMPTTVVANGGPLYFPADGYGLLRLDEQSNISLVREKIVYTMSKGSNDYGNSAEVSVEYELHNQNSANKDIEVLFLTPSRESLTVSEGDELIPTSLAPELRPVNWKPLVKNTVIEPLSGKELSLSRYEGGHSQAQGTRFPLSFKEGETKHIVVRYVEQGGMYDKGVINMIYSHLYYLTPAEFWEGKPQVELEVKLYSPDSKLHSNLLMEQTGPTTYKAVFNELPSEDWYFSYVVPKRLLFPTNIEKDHNLMVLGSVVLLTVIAAVLALYFKKSFLFTIGSICILSFTIYYISKMGGYPFNFIFVTFIDVLVGAGLLACQIWIWKRNKR
ncbi:hypothetical protein A8L34_17365 [Bacillus sp. FJAT-27264]|uniref:hypothetical protein n=1 Tax=Paenibacillus sp. (strain DSM 101736 / FJAT-27264) TaxID=1850362 RepID=UPI000807FE60|nr:hypothetical protein [Bacillus sp. FJAT-27264]OBZ12073.1 hypothetical protein A8L34_17365 [Bacillus sp. FJAT-27264]